MDYIAIHSTFAGQIKRCDVAIKASSLSKTKVWFLQARFILCDWRAVATVYSNLIIFVWESKFAVICVKYILHRSTDACKHLHTSKMCECNPTSAYKQNRRLALVQNSIHIHFWDRWSPTRQIISHPVRLCQLKLYAPKQR